MKLALDATVENVDVEYGVTVLLSGDAGDAGGKDSGDEGGAVSVGDAEIK